MDIVADETVPRAIVERLRAIGHTILSISEVNSGAVDEHVLAQANDRQFLLLTHDRDFGGLAILRGLPITGVLLLETERLSLLGQVERIASVLADENAVWVGRFSVIEPARVRQRML